MELSDLDLEEIARLIRDGMTSGIIDGEEQEERSDGAFTAINPYRISWSLTTNKFES